MGKLVMGFVVMSQVLLILEHLVAVFALKCVIVLKDCLQTPKNSEIENKERKPYDVVRVALCEK